MLLAQILTLMLTIRASRLRTGTTAYCGTSTMASKSSATHNYALQPLTHVLASTLLSATATIPRSIEALKCSIEIKVWKKYSNSTF